MISQKKYCRTRWALVLAAGLISTSPGLRAGDNPAAEAIKKWETTADSDPWDEIDAAAGAHKKWDTTAAAGVTLTRGNSETFLATLSLDTKRKWETEEANFGVLGGYGESKVTGINTKHTEFLQGYGQYNHLFTERFYGALRLEGQYDGLAGIQYRLKVSPLAGYYLIKKRNMTLAVEGGPSLILEHLSGHPSRAYWAARLAERFEYKLTASTKVWESVEYLPKVDDWTRNYLANLEAGIDTSVNKHWSLRFVLQDQYANEPAPRRKKNDLRLIAGTAYKF
jgi:putative salt-induced outer membrane protein YdiY